MFFATIKYRQKHSRANWCTASTFYMNIYMGVPSTYGAPNVHTICNTANDTCNFMITVSLISCVGEFIFSFCLALVSLALCAIATFLILCSQLFFSLCFSVYLKMLFRVRVRMHNVNKVQLTNR